MTCKFMPQIHATHVCTICYAYVCVFTLSRRLRFMRDFVIVDKIQRNMRWHLDFVPWERETFSSGSQCTFRHDETWTKYAYNCVCGWRCACVCVCECSLIWQMYSKQIQFHSRSMANLYLRRDDFLMHISCSFRIVSVCFGGVGVGGKQIINMWKA